MKAKSNFEMMIAPQRMIRVYVRLGASTLYAKDDNDDELATVTNECTTAISLDEQARR